MQEMQEMQVQSLGRGDVLREEMATHSTILAWKVLWKEEPSGLQSTGPCCSSWGLKESDMTEDRHTHIFFFNSYSSTSNAILLVNIWL